MRRVVSVSISIRQEVKIGLTRRREPMDRVHELGVASVPVRFDVHARYFSEDAVTLEAERHQHFGALTPGTSSERHGGRHCP